MFTSHHLTLGFVLLFFSATVSADVKLCPPDRTSKKDERVEFVPLLGDDKTTFFQVRLPIVSDFELKQASIRFFVGEELKTKAGAALALFEADDYFYSEAMIEDGGLPVTIEVNATYSDGTRCDLQLSNQMKHNKALKFAPPGPDA